MPPILVTALLLLASNVFMTFAWYGHLRFGKGLALWLVILISWGIAFFEYCLQVPANRVGHDAGWSAAHLKILQEVLTLVVFVVFSATYLNETIRWNHYVAFGLILLAVVFVFHDW